ncbi:polysaccharide pyruvyl transferase family protein [Longimicrobium terrae]|uniref:Polysaccharide pyruvyl transferase WcaK-like protein n=1 Tax=Longimicrobium terrae TaxID=1639882 RepID=A0A841GWF4_9BACT|nr:polysaccharide pyruvyl transferase family protein [Longimicrobium terrae]MBB4634534.1 polysaccharide pyruvyl transferase WcaK-like protein [Longimicrobium terrae]MBB6068576.1 polysaccharide pyruvyl transferase WcaK-like protein [Longimicrobium terrae]NNC27763.1 hypothetical protein [Longimicrobium terrae]
MSGPMNIVLVNAWHDDNKGDGGIIEATLLLLQPHVPDARFTIVSKFPADHPAFARAHRHLLARHPDVRVLPLVSGLRPPAGRVGRMSEALRWTLLPPRRGEAERAIAGADLVISVGGHYLYNRRADPRDWGRLKRHLHPLRVARAAGVPYVLLAQSLGPFTDATSRRFASPVLRDARAVILREARSDTLAAELGVPDRTRAVLPDVAFALRAEHTPAVEAVVARHGLDRPFWVFTVRGWGTEAESASFLDQMAETVRGVLRQGLAERVALVAHCNGPTPAEDDRVATRQLAERLAGESIAVVDEDLTPGELVSLYGRAVAMVGTRFHSVIFALAGGTPAFAVAYFGPKAQGIMEMLGMSDLCADTKGFRAADVLPRLPRLAEPAYRAEVARKVGALQDELRLGVAERLFGPPAGGVRG